jgi:hypothetical protein
MLRKSLQIFALISMLSMTQSFGQNTSSPQIELGSKALYQEGSKKYSYDNGTYSYENVIDVTGTGKAALYDNAKKWIIANLKTPKESLFFDEDNKTSITANTAIRLKDQFGVTNQLVDFKLTINFKDDKVRIIASDFVYHGLYPGNLFQKSFNDLRPFSKKVMRTIYEEFDTQFEAMTTGLINGIKNKQSDNW